MCMRACVPTGSDTELYEKDIEGFFIFNFLLTNGIG